jgi:hypothetical protein
MTITASFTMTGTDTITPTFSASPTVSFSPTPYAGAGEGTVAISPANVSVNIPQTITIDVTAGTTAWTNGILHLWIPDNWSLPQTTLGTSSPGYISVTATNGGDNIIVVTPIIGQDVYLSVDSLAATSGVLHIYYGEGAGASSNTEPAVDEFTVFTAPKGGDPVALPVGQKSITVGP